MESRATYIGLNYYDNDGAKIGEMFIEPTRIDETIKYDEAIESLSGEHLSTFLGRELSIRYIKATISQEAIQKGLEALRSHIIPVKVYTEVTEEDLDQEYGYTCEENCCGYSFITYRGDELIGQTVVYKNDKVYLMKEV